MRQTLNNFTIIKSITIIGVYVSWLKKNLSFFPLLTHTHTQKLSLSKATILYSLLFIFSSTNSSLLAVFFFSKRFPLGCFLFFFFLVQLPLSLLLHILSLCLLESSSTLLSPSSYVPPKQKSIFSLFISRSIFLSP